MSFGLDSSFSSHSAAEEGKALKAIAIGLVVTVLSPFIIFYAFSALSTLGMLPHVDREQAINTTSDVEVRVEIPASKYCQINIDNPVVSVDKGECLEKPSAPIVRSVSNKFTP